jgi:hypothetical protein
MAKVYIAEFKAEGVMGAICDAITHTGYCHSAMVIEGCTGDLWFCELDGFRRPAYYRKKIKSLNDLLKSDKRIELFEIPKDFIMSESKAMLQWWDSKEKWNYGWLKLASFIFIAPVIKFMKWHYKITGKVFKPILGNVIKKELVCSVAVDKCLKEAGDYDSFPSLDEDCIFPGLWGLDRKFKKYTGV